MNNNYKGNQGTPMRKALTVIICILGIVIVISSFMFVRTYMSHANRWSAKEGSVKNTSYTSFGILSQNVTSTSTSTKSINNIGNSITNLVDSHTPSIVCLQHASSNLVNDVATYFNGNNFDVVVKYSDETNQNSTPIFYDTKKYSLIKSGYFWLSDTPNISSNSFTDSQPYIATWAILTHNETSQTFGIVNIELSKDIQVQSLSLNCILENCNSIFNNTEYTICGTFNCTSKDDSFSIVDNKYNNISVLSNKLFNVGPTCTSGTLEQNDDYVYDYFFGTKKVKCDRYAVIKDNVTNSNGLIHYGVMSNIYFETDKDNKK